MSSTTSSQPQWVETLQATVAGIVEELFDLLSTGEAGLFHCMCFSSKRNHCRLPTKPSQLWWVLSQVKNESM